MNKVVFSIVAVLLTVFIIAVVCVSCGKKSMTPASSLDDSNSDGNSVLSAEDKFDPDFAGYVDEKIPEPENRSVSALPKMPAPTAVTASGGTYNDRVKIYWTHPVGEQPTVYYIYRSNAPDEPVPDYIGGCSYPKRVYYDMTATPGTKYYYKVKSHKLDFNDSVFSNEHMGYMGTKMFAPTNVKASDHQFTDKVHVIWTAPSGTAPTVYYIYRSETPNNQAPTYIGARAYPGTYYDDTTAVAGTDYYYKIKSHKNGYSDSVFSNENLGGVGDWVYETVEDTGTTGYYNSIDVGSDFVPHIAFWNWNDGSLKHASYDGSNWNIEGIDDVDLNDPASIKVGSDNYPRVGYVDNTNWLLRYGAWNGSSWDLETVETDHYPSDVSLALDSNNYPHMSYQDDTDDGALRYCTWNGTSWSFKNVHTGTDIGYNTSIALDSDDKPHITYTDDDNSYTYYAVKIGNWWMHEIVNDDSNYYTSIAADSGNYPCVAMSGTPLLYYTRDDVEWTYQDPGTSSNGMIALALDSQNYPHIAYFESVSKEIRYLYLKNDGWHIKVIDTEINGSNIFMSLALDDLNRPHIAYMDDEDYDIEYATIR